MSIVITDQIPPPLTRASRYQFAWQTMLPGQSVDLPAKQASALRSLFHKRGWRAMSTKHGTDEFPLAAGFLRLWRIADIIPVPVEAASAEIVDPTQVSATNEEIA